MNNQNGTSFEDVQNLLNEPETKGKKLKLKKPVVSPPLPTEQPLPPVPVTGDYMAQAPTAPVPPPPEPTPQGEVIPLDELLAEDMGSQMPVDTEVAKKKFKKKGSVPVEVAGSY